MQPPSPNILFPLLAMVGLTLLVWLWMYTTRFHAMYKGGIRADALNSSADEQRLLQAALPASENLRNLFELPVLFYALCILLYVTQATTPLLLGLAWLYVALRALHSLIHCSYNRVMHRFLSYFLSSLCLWSMWWLFAYALIDNRAISV